MDPQMFFQQMQSMDVPALAKQLASQYGPPQGSIFRPMQGMNGGAGGGFASFILPQIGAPQPSSGTPTSSGGIPGAAVAAPPVVNTQPATPSTNGLALNDAARASLLKYFTANQPGSFNDTRSLWSSGQPSMNAATANIYKAILGL